MKAVICGFLLACILFQTTQSTTLLYSLKIRRAFGIQTGTEQDNKKGSLLLTALPIVSRRTRHLVIEESAVDSYEDARIGGVVANLRYIYEKKWWGEVATGIGKERVKLCGTVAFTNARTGMDDIVVAAGRNFFFGKRTQFVLYGIAGFPTSSEVTAEERFDTVVGTRFYSLGAGSELSHAFIQHPQRALIALAQVRFLHFFTRSWFPVLGEGGKIQPGNAIDLLFTLQYRQQKNLFEAGYGPTWFTNQAVIVPATGVVPGRSSVRQGMYGSYNRLFRELPLLGLPGALGTGISVGRNDRFNSKILTWWVDMAIKF